ncbi:MAG TPA: malto-oligosyltrehalose trehalohydrolase, partial [Devosia sp.]|nr:malto-oligosyltrehalose trehalohydrolase [Devosia sp.]
MAHMPRTVEREQEMKFGCKIIENGVRFRLWAPGTHAVSVKIYDPPQIIAMKPQPRGWYEVEVEGVGPGTRYRFVLDEGTEVPDPASRFQPEDVNGPSEVIDPRGYRWRDLGWRGRPWEETI